MQRQNMDLLMERAGDYDNPICLAVRKSIEVGVVVPSRLRTELAAAGLKINDDEKDHAAKGYRTFENNYRVLIEDADGNVLAMGAAAEQDEALLASILGYVRERDIETHGSMQPLRGK